MNEARLHGGRYLRWSWFSTGTVPFWGLCYFQGTFIVGLYPLVIEAGERKVITWTRTSEPSR